MDILLRELGQFRTRVKIVEDKGLSAVYRSLYFFVRSFGRKIPRHSMLFTTADLSDKRKRQLRDSSDDL